MAHSYGGVLATIAFTAVMVKGLIGGEAFFPLATQATLFMLAMAIVGFIGGAIASRMVRESVRVRLNAELDALERESNSSQNNPENPSSRRSG